VTAQYELGRWLMLNFVAVSYPSLFALPVTSFRNVTTFIFDLHVKKRFRWTFTE
jgi:hypothetical protein